MTGCLALTSMLWQGDATTVECSAAALNVAGRGIVQFPQTGINSDFQLHRAGIGLGVVQGDIQGRIQVGPFQTGGRNSYIGIGGESTIHRIQMAEMRYRPIDSLRVSVGFVEDFWVESGNRSWGFRDVEATSAEAYGWMERGNSGASAVWSSERLVLAVSMHTGEGAYRRERNAGKNTAVYGRVNLLDKEGLYVEGYAQDGSYGFDSVRNHRVGGRVASTPDGGSYRIGLETLKIWGVQGNAVNTPLLFSLWGSVDATEWLRLLGRVEHIQLNDVASQAVLFGVSKPVQPQGNLGVYWNATFNDAELLPLAGSSAATNTHRIVLQLDGRFEMTNVSIIQ
jgi:hypothetical protein